MCKTGKTNSRDLFTFMETRVRFVLLGGRFSKIIFVVKNRKKTNRHFH